MRQPPRFDAARRRRACAPDRFAALTGARSTSFPSPSGRIRRSPEISELLAAVEGRLRSAGLDGLREAVLVAEEAARNAGLSDPKVTSDANTSRSD